VEGQMGQGLKMIEETLRASYENHRKVCCAMVEHALRQVYLQIVDKSAPVSLTTMAKNVGFILKKRTPRQAKRLKSTSIGPLRLQKR